MNSTLIRKRLNRDTRPFVLRLSDGSRVPVAHLDFMFMPPGADLVIVFDKEGHETRIHPRRIRAIEEKDRNGEDLRIKMDMIRQRKRGSPTPFVLQLSDGRTFRVNHPDRMAIGGQRVFIIGRNERCASVDALEIVAVKNIKRKSKTGRS